MSNDILQVKCECCGEIAHEPYIECCECDSNICTSCFASGQEVRNHKNDHKYAVRRNDFPLFDNCNWSAKEECKLLSALSTFGYGNWEEISKSVHTRSKLECQEHYKKYYIESVQYKELKLLPETEQSLFPKPIIPFLYSSEVCGIPPRNNQADQHLAGYNAYRSEFEMSFDNHAESIFNIEDGYSDDDDKDEECMDALRVALVSSLNTRLKERHRRYKVIQNHGLILPNRLVSWLHKFDLTLTRHKWEKLLPFMQLMSGMQFDTFLESLSLEVELLQRISRLCEYRKKGIKTLYSGRLYKQLKKDKDLMYKEQKHITNIMLKKFEVSPSKNRFYFFKDHSVKKFGKRQAMPLDIIDLPGFSILSETEKVLCAMLRLIPKNYLDIKEQLINENNKLGFLRLLDARRIVKIDVNKTRKIYDYLIDEGYISKQNPLPNSGFQ